MAFPSNIIFSATWSLLNSPVLQVIWSFTKLVNSEFASDELRRITARMICCLSCIGNARAVLLEQKAVNAIAAVIRAVGTEKKYAYLRRCCAMALRNFSSDSESPMKVGLPLLACLALHACMHARTATPLQPSRTCDETPPSDT